MKSSTEDQPTTGCEGQTRFDTIDAGVLPVSVHVGSFAVAGGATERHVMLAPTCYADFTTQARWIERACEELLPALGCSDDTLVFRRLFLSDAANQLGLLADSTLVRGGGVSLVGQAPLAPAKLVAWSYHVVDTQRPAECSRVGPTCSLHRGALTHHFTSGLGAEWSEPSGPQTTRIFAAYDGWLRSRGMTLADHVVRTWLFVRDIDVNYRGMVESRRAFFAARRMTADTHYLASSGIEACPGTEASVVMDAYAIEGLNPRQVTYLHAAEHLSPTHLYGVTFERATAVDYADRRHVILSGTASIDHRGRIVHGGDVGRQLDRTLENISALLDEGAATLSDLAYLVVYLRDPGDGELVRRRLRERLGEVPMVLVAGRVCRPGWLVEIEGHAIVASRDESLPPF